MIIPTLIGAFMAVELCKKYDKFKVFYISYVFALLLGIVRFIAGYENMMVYVILNALGGIPLGIAVILQYQFTPDCYEYGQYKTGLKNAWCNVCGADIFYKIKWSDHNSSQCVCVNFNRLPRGEKALFRRQDLPINYGHSAVLAALSGVFALCLYFAFTSLMTMMSS